MCLWGEMCLFVMLNTNQLIVRISYTLCKLSCCGVKALYFTKCADMKTMSKYQNWLLICLSLYKCVASDKKKEDQTCDVLCYPVLC